MLRVTHDPDHGGLSYISLVEVIPRRGSVARSVPVGDDIVLDFGHDGALIGIELLKASLLHPDLLRVAVPPGTDALEALTADTPIDERPSNCPFCGGCDLRVVAIEGASPAAWQAECNYCDSAGPLIRADSEAAAEQLAIDAWNKRS